MKRVFCFCLLFSMLLGLGCEKEKTSMPSSSLTEEEKELVPLTPEESSSPEKELVSEKKEEKEEEDSWTNLWGWWGPKPQILPQEKEKNESISKNSSLLPLEEEKKKQEELKKALIVEKIEKIEKIEKTPPEEKRKDLSLKEKTPSISEKKDPLIEIVAAGTEQKTKEHVLDKKNEEAQEKKSQQTNLREKLYTTFVQSFEKIASSPYGRWILKILGLFIVAAVLIICLKVLKFLWKADGASILKGLTLAILTVVIVGITVILGDINVPSVVMAFAEMGVAITTGFKYVYKPAKEKMKGQVPQN